MTTVAAPILRKNKSEVPTLETGDHLDQPSFHERYKLMPEHVRAELIGGVVIMPSPLRLNHATVHAKVCMWLALYEAATPGARAADNATDILGKDTELQPDTMLILDGGQARENDDGYVVGPPEFVAEVASSSISYDLHSKKAEYEKYGVREYLVLAVQDERAYWFVRQADLFVEVPVDADGIHRSRFLPGLWLDAAAVFRGDTKRIQEVLNLGLQTPEHAVFVASRRQS